MVKITNEEELKDWLEGKPTEWLSILALRCALRAFPTLFNSDVSIRRFYIYPCGLFRAFTILTAAHYFSVESLMQSATFAANSLTVLYPPKALYTTDPTDIFAPKYGVYEFAEENSILSALIILTSPKSASFNAVSTFNFASEAYRINSNNNEDILIWNNMEADIIHLENKYRIEELYSKPLWRADYLNEMPMQLIRMRTELRNSDDGFNLWMNWYERRLVGNATGFALPPEQDVIMHQRLLAQTDDWWKREPKIVNAEIQSWLDELTPPIEPETQSDFGLIFHQTPSGAYEVDQFSGADEVLKTPEACDRHEQARETLRDAAELARGHNIAGGLEPKLHQWAEFLGNGPHDMRVGRLLTTAEMVLKLTEATVAELKAEGTLADLAPRSRELVVLLEALPDIHWSMVNFDPALARRIPLKNDPDVPKYQSVTINIQNSTIQNAVIAGVLTQSSADQIMQVGEGLNAISPDPRQQRRFWETNRNFIRAFAADLWREHKFKILSATLIPAANFLVQYSTQVKAFFEFSPTMIGLLDRLIAALKAFDFLI